MIGFLLFGLMIRDKFLVKDKVLLIVGIDIHSAVRHCAPRQTVALGPNRKGVPQ
jgi:hypothetical protein